jgi:ERF superfamily
MTETLKARAAAARTGPAGGRSDPGKTGDSAVPTIDFEVGDDPEAVPVKVAWARAMRFCRALTKGSTARVNGKDGKLLYTYKYRGVDDVVTLAGVAFRHFGIMVVPVEVVVEYRPAGQMVACYATVTYEVSSLGEGTFRGTVKSEGIDNGDKATVKAEQQAFRVFLTTALCLPTYDPTMDSDATPMVRPEPPGPFGVRDEILAPGTSVQRLIAIQSELRHDPALAATAVPVGDEEIRLWDLVVRTRKAREPQAPAEDGEPS